MPELVRVYVPLQARQLRELAVAGRLPAPVDGVCAPSGSGSEAEEREHAALQRAARAARDSGGPVLIAAADVDTADVDVQGTARVVGHDPDRTAAVPADEAETPDASVVTVSGEILLTAVAALLVGDDVLGTDPALDDRDQTELSWYDPTELAHLVSLL